MGNLRGIAMMIGAINATEIEVGLTILMMLAAAGTVIAIAVVPLRHQQDHPEGDHHRLPITRLSPHHTGNRAGGVAERTQ